MTTGARRGELCALRWESLDLDRAVLNLRAAIAQDGSRTWEKDTKTTNSAGSPWTRPRSTCCALTAASARRTLQDWEWITLAPDHGADSRCWWLLVRRNQTTGELAFYRCYNPQTVPLRELVRVAGRRWTVEESFQTGKGLAGLDEHQVRRRNSWRRWTLLVMLAHALLMVVAANEHTDRPHPPA